MQGLSVKQKIAGSFFLLIAVTLILFVLVYRSAVDNVRRADHVQAYDLAGLVAVDALRTLVNNHIQATFSQLLAVHGAQTEAELRASQQRLAAVEAELDRAYQAYLPTTTDPRDRKAAKDFKTAMDAFRGVRQEIGALLDRRAPAAAFTALEPRLLMELSHARAALVQMTRINEELVGEAVQEVEDAAQDSKLSAVVALVLAVGLSLLCGVLLYRSITRPLDAALSAMRSVAAGDLTTRLNLQRDDEFDAIERGFNNMVGALRGLVAQAQSSASALSASISEIAAMTRQQEVMVGETAAATVQLGANSDEIVSTSRELVRNMGEVSNRSSQAAHLASTGQLGVQRIGEVMRQLSGAAAMVSDKLSLLGERTGGIANMAAGLGKQAQAADGASQRLTELQRLAERTVASGAEIERRVREVQGTVADTNHGMGRFSDEVRRGNTEMMQVGALLQQIIQEVRALAPRIQTVGEGIRVQSQGAGQINEALLQLSTNARQTALALNHAYKAIQNVDQVAAQLRSSVQAFRV